MRLRRLGVAVVAAAVLALAGGGGGATPVASAELHHAAVVIDTAEGVRKFCLAFPEESLDGAEVLRRIEADPVFTSYAGKGQAVCKLSGVGCPADDCFCDRSKYWAYHRAGPGGAAYKFSSAGVSSTEVRDGDVEGWRWGTGGAPPRATVSEVCGVAEPPARTTSSGGGSAPAPTTTAPAPTTTAPPPGATPGPGSPDPPPATAPAGGTAAPRSPAPTPGPTVVPPATGGDGPAPAGSTGLGGETPTVDAPTVDADASTTTIAAEAPRDDAGEEAARRRLSSDPAASRRTPDDRGVGSLVGLAGFVAVLAGVLVWRARLRRANVRP